LVFFRVKLGHFLCRRAVSQLLQQSSAAELGSAVRRGLFLGATWTIGIFGFVSWFGDNIATPMWIEGVSMQPTLNPAHQRGNIDTNSSYFDIDSISTRDVVLAWRPGASEPQRGQIVSLWSPSTPGRLLIKRVVAVDGDRIVPRATMRRRIEEGAIPSEEDFVAIPDGHCWIEGDNSLSSLDSNEYGPVPRALITGQISWLLFPGRCHPDSACPSRKSFSRLYPRTPDSVVSRLRRASGQLPSSSRSQPS
jgi:mitochondrial inner membrane protease subunit 2